LSHSAQPKNAASSAKAILPQPSKAQTKSASKDDDDDDVDLFGSEDEDDKEADELRKKRLEEYAQKKSKSNFHF